MPINALRNGPSINSLASPEGRNIGPNYAARKIYGFPVRDPYQSENDYFKKNPNVGGMATEDNSIILNPHSQLTQEQKEAVAHNEAIRLFMRVNKIQPDFSITPEQTRMFAGTDYASNPDALKQTLLARFLTNDPSAGTQTFEQNVWANKLRQSLNGFPPNGGGR